MRRGTAAAWAAANPVLTAGEIGFETDTGWNKIGDGVTDWNTLPGVAGGAVLIAILGSTPAGTGKSTVVTGTATHGDGSEGTFISVLATGLTIDNGIIFASDPSTPLWYWKRIYSGNIDPRWFGCKTYAVDPTFDCTTIFQTMVNAVPDYSVIEIQQGCEFRLTDGFVITRSHLRITGQGSLFFDVVHLTQHATWGPNYAAIMVKAGLYAAPWTGAAFGLVWLPNVPLTAGIADVLSTITEFTKFNSAALDFVKRGVRVGDQVIVTVSTDVANQGIHTVTAVGPSGTITCVAVAAMSNNQWFMLNDGFNTATTFEYKVDGGFAPVPGRTTIDVSALATATQVATATAAVITAAVTARTLTITGTLHAPGSAIVDLMNRVHTADGLIPITAIGGAPFTVYGMTGHDIWVSPFNSNTVNDHWYLSASGNIQIAMEENYVLEDIELDTFTMRGRGHYDVVPWNGLPDPLSNIPLDNVAVAVYNTIGCRIHELKIKDFYSYAISLQAVIGAKVKNNEITNVGFNGIEGLFQDSEISGNRLDHVTQGMEIGGINSVIHDNVVNQCAFNGIWISASGYGVNNERLDIYGNKIVRDQNASTSGYAMDVSDVVAGAANTKSIHFHDNEVHGRWLNGIVAHQAAETGGVVEYDHNRLILDAPDVVGAVGCFVSQENASLIPVAGSAIGTTSAAATRKLTDASVDMTTVLTGVVTMTNGSPDVTGVGTHFLAEIVVIFDPTTATLVGPYMKLEADTGASWKQVASVTSDTVATLVGNYIGAGGAGDAAVQKVAVSDLLRVISGGGDPGVYRVATIIDRHNLTVDRDWPAGGSIGNVAWRDIHERVNGRVRVHHNVFQFIGGNYALAADLIEAAVDFYDNEIIDDSGFTCPAGYVDVVESSVNFFHPLPASQSLKNNQRNGVAVEYDGHLYQLSAPAIYDTCGKRQHVFTVAGTINELRGAVGRDCTLISNVASVTVHHDGVIIITDTGVDVVLGIGERYDMQCISYNSATDKYTYKAKGPKY
jgi:hypothetical protein